MKRTLLQDFKQIYKTKEGEKKEYSYQVTIVMDTTDYTYRILNVTSGTLWKTFFKTYDEAKNFLLNHPHFEGTGKEIELEKKY